MRCASLRGVHKFTLRASLEGPHLCNMLANSPWQAHWQRASSWYCLPHAHRARPRAVNARGGWGQVRCCARLGSLESGKKKELDLVASRHTLGAPHLDAQPACNCLTPTGHFVSNEGPAAGVQPQEHLLAAEAPHASGGEHQRRSKLSFFAALAGAGKKKLLRTGFCRGRLSRPRSPAASHAPLLGESCIL